MWWHLLILVAAGLLVAYLILVAAMWLASRRFADVLGLRAALRLLPDVIGLLRRLAADRSLPRSVRIKLILLLAYLISPIDLIPDFVPILGYLDDAIVIALTLRSVARSAGPGAIARHWPGTAEGLVVVQRLAGGG